MKVDYDGYVPLMKPRMLGYGDIAVFETPHKAQGHEPPTLEVIVGQTLAYDPAGDTFFTMRLLNGSGAPDSVLMTQGRLVLYGSSSRDRILYEFLMMHDANESKRGRNTSAQVRYGLVKVKLDGHIVEPDEYDEKLWTFFKPTEEERSFDINEAVELSASETNGEILFDPDRMGKVKPLPHNVKRRFVIGFLRFLVDNRRARLVKMRAEKGFLIQIRHFRTVKFVTIGRMSDSEDWVVRMAAQLAEQDDKGGSGKNLMTRLLMKNMDAVFHVVKNTKALSLERVVATWPDLYDLIVKKASDGVG